MWTYYKSKLHDLTDEQKRFIHNTASAYRWCYNWALEYCNKEQEEGRLNPSWFQMNLEFTSLRNSGKHPWLNDYDLSTCRNAFKDLKFGFNAILEHRKGARRPKFKSKKRSKISFHTRDERVRFYDDNTVRIPGFSMKRTDTSIRFKLKNHNIPTGEGIKYYNTRISFDGIDYWISTSIEIPDSEIEYKEIPETIIGIDVGKKTTAYLSDNTSFVLPQLDKISNIDRRKRNLHKSIMNDIRKRRNIAKSTRSKYSNIPKSKNQEKRERKYLKMNHKIHNIWNTHYHQVSKEISKMDIDAVVVETLHMENIRKDHYSSAAITGTSLPSLINMIDYKCSNNGIKVIYAEDGYLSSQICSNCGNIRNPKKSRVYICPTCGARIDRDYNAALNLRNFGLAQYSATVNKL